MAPDPGHERLDYRISMGIRYNEPDWKHRLNGLLEKHKAEIEQILASYGVPLLDGQGKPIRKASVDADDAASSAEAVRSDERRVGKECVSRVRSRGSPSH